MKDKVVVNSKDVELHALRLLDPSAWAVAHAVGIASTAAIAACN